MEQSLPSTGFLPFLTQGHRGGGSVLGIGCGTQSRTSTGPKVEPLLQCFVPWTLVLGTVQGLWEMWGVGVGERWMFALQFTLLGVPWLSGHP